jgi:DNA-binding CsgD family transcriptional regulator
LSHALTNVGAAESFSGAASGLAKLEKGLAVARANGFDRHAGRAYVNLCNTALFHRDYARATHYVEEGTAFCAAHDMDLWAAFLCFGMAWSSASRGQWSSAEEMIVGLSPQVRLNPLDNSTLWLLGWMRVRQGDSRAATLLARVRDTSSLPNIVFNMRYRLMMARAEAAWLAGDIGICAAEARSAYDLGITQKYPWFAGETAFWLWRGGKLDRCPENAAKPYKLQITGDWQGAADEWARIGCPYERAMALMDGDEAAQRDALSIFDGLGAKPASAIVRRQLQEQGVRDLPRGPRSSTRENAAGLTARELEVLELMADGLANPDIAKRLFRSAKTVEHHVSAVLAKLGAATRLEAVHIARERQILPTRRG